MFRELFNVSGRIGRTICSSTVGPLTTAPWSSHLFAVQAAHSLGRALNQ